jgi:hypothetical protein
MTDRSLPAAARVALRTGLVVAAATLVLWVAAWAGWRGQGWPLRAEHAVPAVGAVTLFVSARGAGLAGIGAVAAVAAAATVATLGVYHLPLALVLELPSRGFVREFPPLAAAHFLLYAAAGLLALLPIRTARTGDLRR